MRRQDARRDFASRPADSHRQLLLLLVIRIRSDHVAHSPLVVQGEKAVELRGHYDFDGDDALDGGQKYKAEFEWAPLARWRTELLAEFEQEPGGDLDTTEIAWENVFQLTEQGRYWADFGLLAEYAVLAGGRRPRRAGTRPARRRRTRAGTRHG